MIDMEKLYLDFNGIPIEYYDESNLLTRKVLFEKYNPRKFIIYSSPIQTTVKKLKTVWTPELAKDIQNFHNIGAEAELERLIRLELENMQNIQTREIIFKPRKL